MTSNELHAMTLDELRRRYRLIRRMVDMTRAGWSESHHFYGILLWIYGGVIERKLYPVSVLQ